MATDTPTPKPTPPALPFRPPNQTCNARLARSSGYCENSAGAETGHPGYGRCRLHGGLTPNQDIPDSTGDLWRAMGLGRIMDAAETMTHGDQEYLYEVSNAALVVTRAVMVARMQDPQVSSKELADLSMALQRVDTLLSKYLLDEDPDKAPNTGPDLLDVEAERIAELEKHFT